ncbi:hypothetical protein LH427_15975 [Laribacter hongkongensis]|uniref:hypothetical protein n=1 Tax=Laribacter hongkongensis TaxID=168471 RepID=UPI001EFC9672|nr:hypothetical protein [Laribacter hongkongensis]MCG8999794.1 hypothetical protein [Laribacter hongkongensis]MCG9013029.1 hypothetical protein [Laribacter hongkongensis]MCG9050612.1 hypothetical protein [Laribacter hongkongensis]MCG9063381.1 hypothetical protein [Laribacter hongkongensis]
MKLENVFGVSRDPVATYIERSAVDSALAAALNETRQIIIYGSSKQGKTSLLQRHVADNKRVTVHCGPTTTAEDIYRSFLRQRDVEIVTEKSSGTSRDLGTSISAKFTAKIPFFGDGSAETKGEVKAGAKQDEKRKAIEFNLANAQDVGELLLEMDGTNFFYVLENFHYLSDDVQRQLAFDLRTFEEMGLRFVILGVWRERNRLVQYNGDLQDRIAEVPVEPWVDADFQRIVNEGERILRVTFSTQVTNEIFVQAHGSVAVVQELLKKLCERANITESIAEDQQVIHLDDISMLQGAIQDKVSEYAARHIRSLESIAAGSRARRTTEETSALFLPYYLVRVMVHRSYNELKDGVERKTLQMLIQEQHATPDNVRTSDVTGMLSRLATLQASQKIVPPLFDFDPGTRRIKVVDSTLYFFIDNCDPEEVMAEIPHPDPEQATSA